MRIGHLGAGRCQDKRADEEQRAERSDEAHGPNHGESAADSTATSEREAIGGL